MIAKDRILFALSAFYSKLINGFKNPSALSFQNILVIKMDDIGDVVNASHVFALLKNSHPNSNITVWCKPSTKELFEFNPSIKKVVTDKKDLEKKYDLIIELRGNLETIKYCLTHPPKLFLSRGQVRLKNKFAGGQKHEIDTNLQIIEPVLKHKHENITLEIFFDETNKQKATNFLSKNFISQFAILHTGSKKELKKWSSEKYIQLAEYLKKSKSLDIIFIGDNSEKMQIEKMQKNISFPTFSVAGDFLLLDFAALASKAKLFVGNDSGPMHIAAALNIPTLGLFGPGPEKIFYPVGKKANVVHHILECNPCDQIHCKHPTNTCMNRIMLNEVIEKIEKLMT